MKKKYTKDEIISLFKKAKETKEHDEIMKNIKIVCDRIMNTNYDIKYEE